MKGNTNRKWKAEREEEGVCQHVEIVCPVFGSGS